MPSFTVNSARRTPLWAIALGALVLVSGTRSPCSPEGAVARRQKSPHPHRPAPRSDRPTRQPDGRQADYRGRSADRPADIPMRGWGDIVFRIYHSISEDRILAMAGGVTFFVLLAIFPGIAGVVSLYGLFADPASIAGHLGMAAGILPEGGLQIVREQIQTLTSQPPRRLGLTLLVSLAISLWSANGGIKALFDALNGVYGEKEKRNFFKLNAISLTFTFGLLLFIIAAIGLITLLPLVLQLIGVGDISGFLLKISRWPVLLIVVGFVLALIYRFGPSRDRPKWRWITPGSVFAAVVWLAASALFSWYAENFGSYNKTYGSLGAAIGLMTWLWLSNIVILIGGKLNAATEHQTAKDTTEGEPRPLGHRGAYVADTVGKADR
jgi:membrane protein